MKRILHYICSEALRLKREDQGVIMAISLAVWMFLFVLICGVYTLGTTIQEREALQHASDAAAISAATIQADSLSRMATINKAMAYTYMSMGRKQMDCILMEWLWLINKRFREDERASRNWSQVLFLPPGEPAVDLITLIYRLIEYASGFIEVNIGYGSWRKKCKDCPLLRKENGRDHFCGKDSAINQVLLNGRMTALSNFPITDVKESIKTFKESIKTLKQGIASDKLLMRSLNSMYAQIHRSACESMERAVPMVLRQNLNAVFSQTELEQVYYSAKLPNGAWDPYQTSLIVQTGGDGTQGASSNDQYVGNNGYFSTLSNVENDERLFLNMMGSVNCNINPVQGESAYTLDHLSSLTDYFMPPPASGNGGIFAFLQGNEHSSSGADQWFVRGRPFYGNTPTYVRRDGGGGLQRVFWDSNANPQNGEFRGGGISLHGKGPTRGNHMMAFSLNVGGGQKGFMKKVLDMLLTSLMRLLDVQPSVMNAGGERDPRSCINAKQSMALVADYEWSSAKWVCIPWRKKKSFGRRRYYCQGLHYAFPKYYCGESGDRKSRMFGSLGDLVTDIPFKTIPDMILIPPVKVVDTHGYEDQDGDGKECLTPLSVGKALIHEIDANTQIGGGLKRHGFRSCAIGTMSRKPFIGGLSRIYADDREICKTRSPGEDDVKFDANGELVDVDIYTGACAQPWILNERFFGTDGTITVAVAKRRANPFARLVGRIWDVEKTSPTSIGNPAGEPDKETYMWTMSSARAAFRQSEGAPLETAYRYLNPEAGNDCLSDSVKPRESGCVCGETAQRRLAKQWNLCTTYWEPTLLPVALADQYRAVDGKLMEEPWVSDPMKATSALWKLFLWDFKQSSTDVAEDDYVGWQSLGQENPKMSNKFLLITPPSNVKMERPENQKQELSILKLYEDRLL